MNNNVNTTKQKKIAEHVFVFQKQQKNQSFKFKHSLFFVHNIMLFFNHELHIDIDENETNNAVHYLDQKRETKERLQCLKFATRPFF